MKSEQPTDESLLWDQIDIDEQSRTNLNNMGYEHPTEVQQKAIPQALLGHDLIVRAKTGTGKTTAFMLPSLNRISKQAGPSCIVLSPTRELAIQIADEAKLLATGKDLEILPVYGGAPIDKQTKKLKSGTDVVVGTPGRVMDHIRRGNLSLKHIQVAVLDEADQMLSLGFLEEVRHLLSKLPKESQKLLFSATIEEHLKSLIGQYLTDPVDLYISLDGDQVADTVHHVLYTTTTDYPKNRQLLHIVTAENPESAIVFCNTKKDTEIVSHTLRKRGFDSDYLSSDLSQVRREAVMKRIKNGQLRFLVCTDIASRGVDIKDLSHVFNYSLPEDPAVYLHRTGRTGRIGKKGRAISLMGGREIHCKNILVSKYKINFEHLQIPSKEEVDEQWNKRHLDELKAAYAEGLSFEGYLQLAKYLREKGAIADGVLALALNGFFKWNRSRLEQKKRAARPNTDTSSKSSSKSGAKGGGKSHSKPHSNPSNKNTKRRPNRRRPRRGKPSGDKKQQVLCLDGSGQKSPR